MATEVRDTVVSHVDGKIIAAGFLLLLAALAVTMSIFLPFTPERGSQNIDMSARSVNAYAARYTALGDAYMAAEAHQRVVDAYAARYTALAASQMDTRQRSIDAYAARYTALAGLYTAAQQQSLDAYTARLEGLAAQHFSEIEAQQRARAADTARWEAMAAHYLGR